MLLMLEMQPYLSLVKVCIIISAKSIKLHLYWAMKNCGNDPEVLYALLIDNILNHYMVSSIKSDLMQPE